MWYGVSCVNFICFIFFICVMWLEIGGNCGINIKFSKCKVMLIIWICADKVYVENEWRLGNVVISLVWYNFFE